MNKITLSEKTGFRIIDPTRPVNIRDTRGILFYSTEAMTPKVEKFNLPEGSYLVDGGNISPLSSPVEHRLARLPFPERLLRKPYDFSIEFLPNPNKCTIFWDEKAIVFDESFREKPLPYLHFILFHEIGHARYSTEKYADLYASNAMLKLGYNPSQVGEAQIMSLSDRQDERKEFLIDNLS